jgi:hypothetical protein
VAKLCWQAHAPCAMQRTPTADELQAILEREQWPERDVEQILSSFIRGRRPETQEVNDMDREFARRALARITRGVNR